MKEDVEIEIDKMWRPPDFRDYYLKDKYGTFHYQLIHLEKLGNLINKIVGEAKAEQLVWWERFEERRKRIAAERRKIYDN